jgi:hypothetical protein
MRPRLVLWSDIAPLGGGTFVAPDSIAHVARFFAAHPVFAAQSEGVLPGEMPFGRGSAAVINPRNVPAAPAILSSAIRSGCMCFNQADLDDFSPVEQSILNALGVERRDFQPTSPSKRIMPERVKRQQAVIEEECRRLAAAA